MSRFLLDTNILSNATKPEPSAALIEWMSEQANEDLFIAALTLAELWYGIEDLPAGRKRKALEKWFEGPEGPQAIFAGRILAFDERAALIWGRLMSEGNRLGRPRSALDMMQLAIAEAHGCTVATDNEKHFFGLPYLNPMRDTKS